MVLGRRSKRGRAGAVEEDSVREEEAGEVKKGVVEEDDQCWGRKKQAS